MDQTWTAVLKQDSGWWIGWIEELPGVNAQERTRDRLLVSLRSALDFNRGEARAAAGTGYEELKV